MATLGLVIALAGLGVGIGVSQRGTTATALGGAGATSTTPQPGKARAGTSTSMRPSMGVEVPAVSSTTVPAKLGTAPEGLTWVGASSTAGSSLAAVPSSTSSGTNSTESGPALGTSFCSILGCPSYGLSGRFDTAVLSLLFTRTANGVTLRAFNATWAVAPLDLVPVASGSSAGGSGRGATGSSSGSRTSGTPAGAASTSTTTTTTTTRVAPPPLPATTITTTTTTLSEPGTSVSPPAVELPVSCVVSHALVVEVSDAGAVGIVTVPLGPTTVQPIEGLEDEVVGVPEQSPMAVVVAHTDDETVSVRAEFAGGGVDQMDVIDHWAVLVDETPATGGAGIASQGTAATQGQASVFALSGNGTVLEEAELPGSGALALPIAACRVPDHGVTGQSGSEKASGSPGSVRAGWASTSPPAPKTGG